MRWPRYWRFLRIILLSQLVFWASFAGLRFLVSTAQLEVLQLQFPLITIVASTTLALVALGLLPLTRFNPRQVAGAVFLALIAADAAFTAYSGPDLAIVRYAVQYWAISAGAIFVASLAASPLRTWRVLSLINLVLLVILLGVDHAGTLTSFVLWLDPVAVLAVAGYIGVRLVRMARQQADNAAYVGAVLMVGITAMAFDAAVNLKLLAPAPIQATTLFPLYLVTAIALELARYGASMHQALHALNVRLQRTISLQEFELSEAAARMRAQARELAIGQERQRLVKDMHDGAGGLLSTLLMRVRYGKIKQDQLCDHLQEVLYDLHHMMDSMDCAEEGLDIALAVFRERISPRLQHAGVTMEWRDKASRPLPEMTATSLIQVYRILQEAVTNILRHSQANQIVMTLEDHPSNGRVQLSLRDNGVGFVFPEQAPARRTQRGLQHMQSRAESIGGECTLQSSPGAGTMLTLIFPARSDMQAL